MKNFHDHKSFHACQLRGAKLVHQCILQDIHACQHYSAVLSMNEFWKKKNEIPEVKQYILELPSRKLPSQIYQIFPTKPRNEVKDVLLLGSNVDSPNIYFGTRLHSPTIKMSTKE